MIKVRLHGLLPDIERMAADMKKQYDVVDVSRSYKDRGESEFYRIYVTMKAGKAK